MEGNVFKAPCAVSVIVGNILKFSIEFNPFLNKTKEIKS